MELVLTKIEDLEKLKGWRIDGATLERQDVAPVLVLQMSHLAAECPVCLKIKPVVSFGRSGNVMLVTESLSLHIEDVKA